MGETRGERERAEPAAQHHRREVVAHVIRSGASIRPIAEPELAGFVTAPALDLIVVEKRARVS
jgi:hypothetical protein